MSGMLTDGLGLGVADGVATACAPSRPAAGREHRDRRHHDDQEDTAGGEHTTGTAQS